MNKEQRELILDDMKKVAVYLHHAKKDFQNIMDSMDKYFKDAEEISKDKPLD